MTIDPARDRFEGTQRIAVHISTSTPTLTLNARGLHIARATLSDRAGEHLAAPLVADVSAPASSSPSSSASPSASDAPPSTEITLRFDPPVAPGEATLEIAFDGAYGDSSPGLFHVEHEGRWYAATDFEPSDARRAFPCFDEPALKVPWEIALTVPDGVGAYTNMPETARTTDAAHHTVTVRFATSPPTSSYLVAMVVGPFDVVEGARTPVPIRAIVPRGMGSLARTALDFAATDLVALGDYFGRPYPYPKLDLVAVPGFSGAMENPGLITFATTELLLDPARVPVSARREAADTVAHELSHQWFGDLVTMAWWDDLWLNEGFATWMATRVVDHEWPSYGARFDALEGRSRGMALDVLATSHAIRQPVLDAGDALASFDAISYQKGAAVVGMLESWLGAEVFRDGVRRHFAEHPWGNATATELFAALSQASGRDVSAVARTFVDQPGAPLVTADVVCDPGQPPAIRLSQSQFAGPSAGATPRRWIIPVCYAFEADAGPQRRCTLLADAEVRAPIEGATRCPRWIDPNPGLEGYYLFALTPSVRAMIEPSVLRTLSATTRWGLLDDARTLFWGGGLPVDELLGLYDRFRSERDPHVAALIVSVLARLDGSFVPLEDRAALRTWIAGFLHPMARDVGMRRAPHDDDDRVLLRGALLASLGAHGDDPAMYAMAERVAQRFVRDPHAVDPEEAAWALPLSCRRASAARLRALLATLAHTTDPSVRDLLAGSIGSFERPEVLREALRTALGGAVNADEFSTVVGAAVAPAATRAIAVAWLREHVDEVSARLDALSLAYAPKLTSQGACTREEVDAERAFWGPRIARIEGGERMFAAGLQVAERCIALRASEGARLHAFLAR